MKDELGGKIMTEFVDLRQNIFHLIDDDNSNKKAKRTKKYV